MQLLAESGLEASRRMIDICGDGTNNAGRDVGDARDDAIKAGITINGLTIINDHAVSWTYAHVQPPGGLPKYYRENVTGGPGSFVLEVHDFHTFGEAMMRKPVTEVSQNGASGGVTVGELKTKWLVRSLSPPPNVNAQFNLTVR